MRTNDKGQKVLVFSARLFPACPLDLQREYLWDGNTLQPLSTTAQVYPYADTLSYCGFLVEHAANVWGREVAIQLIDSLLPLWPPKLDADGKPYPPDAPDEWRFRKAVYLAELGEFEAAHSALEDLLSSPSISSSRWLVAAQGFRQTYRTADDLYRACLTTTFCRAADVLSNLLEQQETRQVADILSLMNRIGVVRRSTGYFDFDGGRKQRVVVCPATSSGRKIGGMGFVPHRQPF